MNLPRKVQLTWRSAAFILALWILSLAVIVSRNSQAPLIAQEIGETSLHFTADRAWALLPDDCVTLQWQVEGIKALHIEGRGEIGQGAKAFCPAINDADARIEVWTPDGLYREYQLRVHFLPDLLVYLAALVGSVCSLGLMAFYGLANRLSRPPDLRWLLVCAGALVLVGMASRLGDNSPPRLDADDGQVAVAIWAEKAGLVYPQEAVEVEFSVAGAESARFQGELVGLTDSWGQAEHRDEHGRAFRLEAVGADGVAREYELPIPSLFGGLGQLPLFYYWSLLFLLAAGLVYLPMAWAKARTKWRRHEWTDLAAAGAFAFAALCLYAPFGMDSPPMYENWGWWSYFEGNLELYSTELPMRFFMALPTSLGHFIHPDSSIGFHLVQLGIATLLPTLLYGLARKAGLRALQAFLLAALFFAYPINTWRVTPRFAFNSANIMWLLLAAYCALDWLETSRRRAIAGTALALFFNVGSYEVAMPLLALLPFALWLRRHRLGWQRMNLALLFFAAVAFKGSYLLLLLTTDRPMYKRRVLSTPRFAGIAQQIQQDIEALVTRLSRVYDEAFVQRWGDALEALADNQWLLPTLLAWLCLGGTAVWLAWRDKRGDQPPLRKLALACAGGFASVIPATIMLITLPRYGEGNHEQLYLYVQLGAAIAVFSGLLLLARLFAARWRDAAIMALCLLLLLPGLSWLFATQAEWTASADLPAHVYRQILEIAPRAQPGARLAVLSELSDDELESQHVKKLRFGQLFPQAMRVLYQDQAPREAFFCRLPDKCSSSSIGGFRPPTQEHVDFWRQTIVLELRRDLDVALVEDPVARFGWDMRMDYDASLLIDADASLPPRAHTLLNTAVESGGGQTPLSPPVESGRGQTPLSPPVESGGG